MSGGGSKPRGGKMGTSIKESISGEAVVNVEKELAQLVEQLDSLRRRISDAKRCYPAAEKAEAHLEMELAKCQKEIDSLNAQHSYIEKQLDLLKNASRPKKDELDRLKELDSIIHTEEKELEKLSKCSAKLRDRASNLQNKIENVGDERLKNQKLKVTRIQRDIDKTSTKINHHKVKIVTGEKMVEKLLKASRNLK